MCLQIIGGGSWQKNQSRAKYDLSLGPVFQPKRIAIWLILQRSKSVGADGLVQTKRARS